MAQTTRAKTNKSKSAKKKVAAAAANPCDATIKMYRQASAVVSQVLLHFGAGYGSAQLAEDPTLPLPEAQIFEKPDELFFFSDLLLTSTIRNWATLNWDTDQPGRDAVCTAAFAHGAEARAMQVANGDTYLTYKVIIETLRHVQSIRCVVGGGGGDVCDF